jgi:hypothetical protein
LLTLAALLEQPSSRTAVAVGDVPVDVAVAFKAARLETALLARCASMPVAAASPITAAESRAMMQERMKTRRVQPHIVRGTMDMGWSRVVTGCACELKGEETVWPP